MRSSPSDGRVSVSASGFRLLAPLVNPRTMLALQHREGGLQDRRSLCTTPGGIEIRSGPSPSHARARTPWRDQHGPMADMVSMASIHISDSPHVPDRSQAQRRIGSRQIVVVDEPSLDTTLSAEDLYSSSKVAPAYSPSKAVVHQSQCYESEVRPWRHSLHSAALPSPPMPRPAYRPASRGVLRQPKQRRAARKKRLPSPGCSIAMTTAVLTAAQEATDGAVRRFSAHEALSTQHNLKVPTLGISASFLESFIAANSLEDEVPPEEQIKQIFEHFSQNGRSATEQEILLFRTAIDGVPPSGDGDGAGVDETRDVPDGESKQTVSWFGRWKSFLNTERSEVSLEDFQLLYTGEEAPRAEKLSADFGRTVRCTAAIGKNVVAPLCNPSDCLARSYAFLHRDDKDDKGQLMIGPATVFISHARQYNFVTMAKAVIAHLRALEAKNKQPVYAWLDVFSCELHSAPATTFEWAMAFAKSVGQMQETLVILEPWDDPVPMTRSWCLWEILATVLHSNTLSITMPPQQHADFQQKLEASFGDVVDALLNVDSRKAQADIVSEQRMIDAAVVKTIGHDRLSEMVVSKLRDWLIKEARGALAKMDAAKEEAAAAAAAAAPAPAKGKGKKAPPKANKGKKGAAVEDEVKPAPPKESPLPTSVARFLMDLGQLEESQAILEKLVKQRQSTLGQRHTDTLDAMTNLVVCIRKRSHSISRGAAHTEIEAHDAALTRAETIARHVLQVREEADGKKAMATLTAVGNLAVLLHGRFSFSAQHHPDPAHVSELLAHYKQFAAEKKLDKIPLELRKLIEAEKLMLRQLEFVAQRQRECLKKGIEVDTHMLEMECRANYSQILFASGGTRLMEAELMCRDALLIAQRIKGDEHKDALLLAVNYASIKFANSQMLLVGANQKQMLRSQQKHEEAIDLFQSIYTIRRRILGSDHADTLNVKAGLNRLKQLKTDPFAPPRRPATRG